MYYVFSKIYQFDFLMFNDPFDVTFLIFSDGWSDGWGMSIYAGCRLVAAQYGDF